MHLTYHPNNEHNEHASTTDSVEAGAPADTIIVTPEMIEAGLVALYNFDIMHPMEAEMREAVKAVFLSMLQSRQKYPEIVPRSFRSVS
jgi:hypothetical protein